MAVIPPVRPDAALRAPADIRNAIREASAATGVYQFIESTWLQMVREHGAKHGLDDLSRSITPSDKGPRVADPALRAKILELRDDPKLAAAMAAELARGNHVQLGQSLGREIGATDLYLAHFLGAGGATRFLTALRTDPGRPAADVLPEAASANRAVFFASDGRARSIDEIYDRFAAKFEPGGTEAQKPAAEPAAAPTRFEFAAATGSTRALEAVLRRTALATLSGNILSPTVIAALASLDAPATADAQDAARAARSGERTRR
jgi:hypothetical protein